MTWQRSWTLLFVLSALLIGMLFFARSGWIAERDAQRTAEAKTAEQQKHIDELRQQQEQMKSALADQVALLEKEKKRPISPPQFVSETNELIPNLPKPLEVRAAAIDPSIPEGPQTQEIVVPQQDLVAIRDAQLACREDHLRLSSCEAQAANVSQQLAATEAEKQQWKTAARGGSRWHRTVQAAKWFAIGAGAGVTGYALSHR